MISTRTLVISSLLMPLALSLIMTSCNNEPKNPRGEQIERGKALFTEYCTSCHGEDARGKLIDTLSVQPANLRLIQKMHRSAEFPIAEVARVIDGRKLVAAHGAREMPVWGDIFRQEGLFEEGQEITEEQLKGKLADIIAYLMAIQE